VSRTGITGAVIAVVLLVAAALSPAAWGAFPGRDGRIAFTTETASDPTIATMEPDGSGVRTLTSGWGPSWSADGKRIVYNRASRWGPDIFLIRANGSGLRRLTSSPHWWEAAEGFSPDGRRIVFSRIFSGRNPRPEEIIIMRLRDLKMRVLTTDGIGPQWSPNGRRIVFSDQSTTPGGGLAIIRPDGTHKRRLTHSNFPFSYFTPAYTADGRTIYFERFPEFHAGHDRLMKIGAFGGPVQRVPVPTPDPVLTAPAPNPEGGCVVGGTYTTSSFNHYGIYALGKTCPTQGWVIDPGSGPSWQPLPNG
jgi:tricorn protease-like protein